MAPVKKKIIHISPNCTEEGAGWEDCKCINPQCLKGEPLRF